MLVKHRWIDCLGPLYNYPRGAGARELPLVGQDRDPHQERDGLQEAAPRNRRVQR